MLDRLSRLVSHRPRIVAAMTVAFVILAGAIGGPLPGLLKAKDDFDDPGSQSAAAVAAIRDATGADAAPGVIAIVPTPGGARSASAATAVDAARERLASTPGVARVDPPTGPGVTAADGSSAMLAATLSADADAADVVDAVETSFAGTDVLLGGGAVTQEQVGGQVQTDLARAELLVMPLLFVLALLVFRSPVAALLPVLVGGATVMGAFLALRAVDAAALDMSVFALNLVTGLGLGLAVDYSLLMVSRFREELAGGAAPRVAVATTVRTAGRTVVFSALTVAAALAALLVFPQTFLRSMGVAGIAVPFAAALISLTLLPALLALLGHRVDALTPARWRRREPTAGELPATRWYRLARWVLARPVRVALVTGGALLALGAPFLGVRFQAVDATVLPTQHSARQVADVLVRDYGGDRSSPIVMAVHAGPGQGGQVAEFRLLVMSASGDAEVSPARDLGAGVWRIDVAPRGSALSDATQGLVEDLRALGTPLRVDVGGQTARFLDQQDVLAARIPWGLALICGTTFVLLFLMTGSVVLPVKAIALNALTISATFGLLVLIFQDGNLEGLLAFTSQGALEATQPVLLFAVAFALSTDYGTFLLARIQEARDAGAAGDEAVAVGLARTGRIVTAAAVLLMTAIGAFATSEIVFIKLVGVGTALAVLIDATVVRAFLVPALMGLLGRANWWAPSWMRAIHGRVGIHEEATG